MIVHTFHIRPRASAEPAQIERFLAEVRGFQGHVPGLLETYVGHNLSEHANGFTVGAAMKFTDKAALDAYIVSPIHKQLLGWAGPMIEAVQEVDFEA